MSDLSKWISDVGAKHGFTSSSDGEAEVCEPVRPSEVITGSASSQYSYGDVTDETAAEGQTIVEGTRENAQTDDNDDAGQGYTDGSNPMQSPNMPGNFAKRYGIGFLCFNYNTWNDLTEVQGYQSPTSTYQAAFRGMDKTKQFNDPTSAQIVKGIQDWTKKLADDLDGCGAGELVVSFQGHGQGGNIYGVDERAISPSNMMQLARAAEARNVSITYILDACETGGAVTQFQDHAADRTDQNIDATEGAGQVCSEENTATAERLRDMMAHARELIMLAEGVGRHGSDMVQATMSVQAAERAGNDAQIVTAWNQVTALNTRIVSDVRAMQNQFETNMDFGNDPEMQLSVIERAFSTVLAALGRVAPQSGFDLDNDWCAPVGAFQDTVSDGANRIITLCNNRAREYSASRG